MWAEAFISLPMKEDLFRWRGQYGESLLVLVVVCIQAGISGPTRGVEKGAESPEALSQELMKDTFEDWQKVYAWVFLRFSVPITWLGTTEHFEND